jgi:hypothetical protein
VAGVCGPLPCRFGPRDSRRRIVLVQFVAWRGIIPAPGILYFLIAGLDGVVYFVRFMVHRLLGVRPPGMWSTVTFPVALQIARMETATFQDRR